MKPKLWKRLVAVILDFLLVSIPFSLIIAMLRIEVSNFVSQIVFVLVEILYFSLVTYYWDGKTVGKAVLSLKVISTNGRLSLSQLFRRFLFRDGLMSLVPTLLTLFVSPGITNLLSFIVLIWIIYSMVKDPHQRGMHDRFARTEVVTTK